MAVIGLIALNTVVFLAMNSMTDVRLQSVIYDYALVPIRFSEPERAMRAGLPPGNWWQLLTNTFMHGGWLHLIFNMWSLWIFGPAMEARCGRMGFLTLYVGGALVASATHLAANWLSVQPALGASGAIAGVIAAYAMVYPRQQVVLLVPVFFFPLFVPVSAWFFAIFWFVLQVLQGTHELFAPSMAGGIAWWAHIGGFLFGAFFAIVAARLELGHAVRVKRWRPRGGSEAPDVGPWGRRSD